MIFCRYILQKLIFHQESLNSIVKIYEYFLLIYPKKVNDYVTMKMLKLSFICYTCNIECREGWYGDSCRLQCLGHCRDGVTCNHVTGRCDTGCAAGWTGTLCKKGKYPNIVSYIFLCTSIIKYNTFLFES